VSVFQPAPEAQSKGWTVTEVSVLTSDLIEAYRRLRGAAVSNAIETFNVRLRNEGFADARIRCLFGDLRPVVGHAVTLRIRCSTPPPVGHQYRDRTDWWSFIGNVPAPRIVVAQDIDERPGLGAFVGGLHASILGALGCVAYVTNGSVRDLDAAHAAGFQFFASGVSISHGFAHIIDFGEPVEVGGLTIASGDYLFGDRDGLTSLPPAILAEIPSVVARMSRDEQQVLDLCAGPDFSITRLRKLLGVSE
jgi:4-hydroxy-4-methyl-2-oxoglutarate aldolase